MHSAAPLHVLLVGAGHTHLHVIDQAESLRRCGVDLVVVAPAVFRYSGTASAVATGALPDEAGTIDVRRLAAARGVTHHVGRVVRLDPGTRRAMLDDGRVLGFDIASFNIGSVTATSGMRVDPGVITAKPLEGLGVIASHLDRWPPGTPLRVAIVGGGPTGLELAGNIAARDRPSARIALFERARRPGQGLPPGARARVVRRLYERGVSFRTGAHVTVVGPDHVVADSIHHAQDLVVLATGLVAHPLVAELGLGDDRGIPVTSTLQHVDLGHIHAVGDCAHFCPRPLPRLGVFGVRQGPVLAASLRARARGEALPTYEPQQQAMQILDLGGGRGLAVRGRWWAEGRLPLLAKRMIDRRWLRMYQGPH